MEPARKPAHLPNATLTFGNTKCIMGSMHYIDMIKFVFASVYMYVVIYHSLYSVNMYVKKGCKAAPKNIECIYIISLCNIALYY